MKKNIEKEIMEKIQKKEVKMKPRWWFKTIRSGERGMLGLLMLGSALLLAGMIYTTELLGPGDLWSMGGLGREALADSLPYQLIAGSLIVTLVSGLVYSKLGDNYKKTLGALILRVVALITVITVIVTLGRMALERGWLIF